jgi:hypothetical protein
MALSPRFVGLVSLLALFPVVAFMTLSPRLPLLPGTLTGVNVLLITVSLYYLFGDSPSDVANGGVAS